MTLLCLTHWSFLWPRLEFMWWPKMLSFAFLLCFNILLSAPFLAAKAPKPLLCLKTSGIKRPFTWRAKPEVFPNVSSRQKSAKYCTKNQWGDWTQRYCIEITHYEQTSCVSSQILSYIMSFLSIFFDPLIHFIPHNPFSPKDICTHSFRLICFPHKYNNTALCHYWEGLCFRSQQLNVPLSDWFLSCSHLIFPYHEI